MGLIDLAQDRDQLRALVNSCKLKVKLSLAHRIAATSRLPHFLDSRLTDGGKVVSLTRQPRFTPRKIPRG
jgi:hypothetical protein